MKAVWRRRGYKKRVSEAISKAKKGLLFTNKHKRNISIAQRKRFKKKSERMKCARANLGNHHTKSARIKIGEASKLRWANKKYRNKVRKLMRRNR